MSKKKDQSNSLLQNLIEAQVERLRQVLSMFYPDEKRAEFIKAIRVGKVLKNYHTAAKRFTEDEQAWEKCIQIIKNAKKYDAASMEIDFSRTALTFQSLSCADYSARVLFKAAPGDIPVYLKTGYENENILLKFLVDGEGKEVFLTLEDRGVRDKNNILDSNGSFIRLPEFHAVIRSRDRHGKCDGRAGDDLCFTVSFSQAEGKCVVEKIYGLNICLFDRLFPPTSQATGED